LWQLPYLLPCSTPLPQGSGGLPRRKATCFALRGVEERPIRASALLGRKLLIYGLGGLIASSVGIKLIDLVVHNLIRA